MGSLLAAIAGGAKIPANASAITLTTLLAFFIANAMLPIQSPIYYKLMKVLDTTKQIDADQRETWLTGC